MPEKIKTMEEIIDENFEDEEINESDRRFLAKALRSAGFIHSSEIRYPERIKQKYYIGYLDEGDCPSLEPLTDTDEGRNDTIDLFKRMNGES